MIAKPKVIRQSASQQKSLERETNKEGPPLQFEEVRPETVFRFVFQDEVNQNKNSGLKNSHILKEEAEYEGEKQRIKEE